MQINKPKVSVVTIVWNDAEGFLATARSIIKQSYDNIEWVVVDGNSTDGTAEYIKNISPEIDQYIIEKDSGIYNAMNKGINMLTGDWVIFMNADDIFFDSNSVSHFVKNIKETDDVIYSDILRREDRKVQQYRSDDMYKLGMVFDHQSTFVKAKLYKKYKYDEKLKISGDLNFFSNLRCEKYSFRKLPDFISAIKPFDTGASSAYQSRQAERVKVLKFHFDSVELRKHLEGEFRNAYKNKLIENKQLLTLLKTLEED